MKFYVHFQQKDIMILFYRVASSRLFFTKAKWSSTISDVWASAVENKFVIEGLNKCIDVDETDTVVIRKAKAKLNN